MGELYVFLLSEGIIVTHSIQDKSCMGSSLLILPSFFFTAITIWIPLPLLLGESSPPSKKYVFPLTADAAPCTECGLALGQLYFFRNTCIFSYTKASTCHIDESVTFMKAVS